MSSDALSQNLYNMNCMYNQQTFFKAWTSTQLVVAAVRESFLSLLSRNGALLSQCGGQAKSSLTERDASPSPVSPCQRSQDPSSMVE
jgi:hypothetical protein